MALETHGKFLGDRIVLIVMVDSLQSTTSSHLDKQCGFLTRLLGFMLAPVRSSLPHR